ncbi:MAG: hypothetical protein KBA61_05005 [Spirochaetes bacterium]|nr:hypothetical protein [Spirochaetota bacterium]
MKKFVMAGIIFIMVSMLISVPENGHAFQVGLGGYSYLNWNELAWPEMESAELDPVLQVGPGRSSKDY